MQLTASHTHRQTSRNWWVILLTAAAVSLLFRVASADEDSARVLVVVNGDSITTADLDRELIEVHRDQSMEERRSFEYRNLLKKLVNDRLIIQEATALGMDEEPWLQAMMQDFRERNAVKYFVADNFDPDLTISEDEVMRRFLTSYSRLRVRTVSVGDSAEAAEMVEAVRNGADMDSLAQEASLDVHRLRGGLHPDKYRADVEPTLREYADTMDVGQVSEPFPYRDVYAFLRVESRTPADTAELSEHRQTIESVSKSLRQRGKWEEFVVGYMSKYTVKVDTARIDSILADSAILFTQEFVNKSQAPVLSVDGDLVMTESDLRKDVSRTAMEQGDVPVPMVMANTLENAQQRLVLLAAARDGGYLSDERVERRLRKSLDSALVEVYLKETVVSQIRFNWDEFEEYYEKHLDEFRAATKYQLARIEVEDERTALEIADRLQDGADFGFLARQYDPNPDRKAEENEWVTLGNFPASIQKAIETLEVGEATRPFETESGWIILQLKSVKIGEPLPIKRVEGRIRKVMFQRKFNELLDEALGILKDNSTIEYNQEAIDEYFGSKS